MKQDFGPPGHPPLSGGSPNTSSSILGMRKPPSSSNYKIPLQVSIRKTLTDFAENTTIHGIGYVFNAMLPFIERCLWAVVFGFFAFLAIYWSAEMAVEWQDDPVVTTVKSTGRSMKDILKPIENTKS